MADYYEPESYEAKIDAEMRAALDGLRGHVKAGRITAQEAAAVKAEALEIGGWEGIDIVEGINANLRRRGSFKCGCEINGTPTRLCEEGQVRFDAIGATWTAFMEGAATVAQVYAQVQAFTEHLGEPQ
jgi:hypothetical protein